MKHEQLVAGLGKLGFESDMHGSDLCIVVTDLMGIPEGDMSWDWCDLYVDFLSHAARYEITGEGHNLLPLAETCYTFLVTCAERERKKRQLEHVQNA